jgi:hypothetical protein
MNVSLQDSAGRGAEKVAGAAGTSAAPLRVHAEGHWFEPPRGPRADTRRRENLRALLVRLALARVQHPGEPVAADALIAAAWPGERILPAAARNRLHVALATLRAMGLRAALRSCAEGYLLDPGVPLELCGAE